MMFQMIYIYKILNWFSSGFGVQALNVKSVMKHIAPLLENRDKDVRQQAKLLAVELFRWIGDDIALKPRLQNIKPLQVRFETIDKKWVFFSINFPNLAYRTR